MTIVKKYLFVLPILTDYFFAHMDISHSTGS